MKFAWSKTFEKHNDNLESAGFKVKFAKEVVDSYKREYEEKVSDFRELDKKAHVTITIGGIFFAAIIGFSKDVVLEDQIVQQIIIMVTVSTLILSMVLSITAMWMVETSTAPGGDTVQEFYEGIERSNLPDKEHYRFYVSQFIGWDSAIAAHVDENEKKSFKIRWSQYFLVFRICSMTAIFFLNFSNNLNAKWGG